MQPPLPTSELKQTNSRRAALALINLSTSLLPAIAGVAVRHPHSKTGYFGAHQALLWGWLLVVSTIMPSNQGMWV